MARKRDIASEVVAFFENSPIDTAETVLGIVKGIVDRRKPATRKPRTPRAAAAGATTDAAKA